MNDHESFLFNLPDTPQLIHQFNDIESFLLYLNDLVLDQENHQLVPRFCNLPLNEQFKILYWIKSNYYHFKAFKSHLCDLLKSLKTYLNIHLEIGFVGTLLSFIQSLLNDICNDPYDYTIYSKQLDSKTNLLIEKLNINDNKYKFIDDSIHLSNIMDKFNFQLFKEENKNEKIDVENYHNTNNESYNDIYYYDELNNDNDSFFFYDDNDELINENNELINLSNENDKMEIEIDNESLSIDDNEKQRIDNLIDKLSLLNDDDNDIMSSQIQLKEDDISILYETKKLKKCLELLNIQSLNDSTLFKLCHLFINESLSFIKSKLFFKYSLKIFLERLKTQASRILIQCFIHCIKKQPIAVIESVFIPVISNNIDINQSEAIHRVLKSIIDDESIDIEYINIFMDQTLSISNNNKSFIWNEPLIDLFHKIISSKVLLSNDIIHSLIKNIENQLDHIINSSKKASLKTATLLFNVINKYEKVITDDIDTIKRIANRIDNYMAKKILKRIE